MGLSSAEFWDLTPREFVALLDRHREHERLLNYRAGLTAAAVYNVNIPDAQKRVEPLDFFELRDPTRVATDEEIEAKMLRFAELINKS